MNFFLLETFKHEKLHPGLCTILKTQIQFDLTLFYGSYFEKKMRKEST